MKYTLKTLFSNFCFGLYDEKDQPVCMLTCNQKTALDIHDLLNGKQPKSFNSKNQDLIELINEINYKSKFRQYSLIINESIQHNTTYNVRIDGTVNIFATIDRNEFKTYLEGILFAL